MLSARIATAAVLAPALLAAILFLPSWGLALLLGVVVLLASWEWIHLVRPGGAARPTGMLLAMTGLLLAGWWLMDVEEVMLLLLSVAVLWWIVAVGWTLRNEVGVPLRPPRQSAGAILGGVVLWPPWLALVYLHAHVPDGALWIVFLLLLIWSADTGAYFAGRAFGRHRLAPRTSPGKTWEGLLGGGLLAGLAGWAFVHWAAPEGPPVGPLVALGLAVVLVSVVGDLFESMLKRQYGVKDSGTLLPGHGGLLDRVDSLTAGAPVLVAGLAWWQATI